MKVFNWLRKKKAQVDDHPDALSPFWAIGCLGIAFLFALAILAIFLIPYF